MPGPAHETLIAFLAQRPDVLSALLVTLGHPSLAANLEARDATLRVANPLEVRPDLVLFAEGDEGPWAVVEVQLKRDETKRRRWLAAAGILFDTRGTMGDLIVLTHDAAVARWARTIAHTHGPGGTSFSLQPLVLQLTLAEVERLLATGSPELAVLATWAVHDQRGKAAVSVVEATAECILDANPELQPALWSAMLSMLEGRLLQTLRAKLMKPFSITPTPAAAEFLRDMEAHFGAIAAARSERRALLAILTGRGFEVTDDVRARIEACLDADTLHQWVVRAIHAHSLDDVFAAP